MLAPPPSGPAFRAVYQTTEPVDAHSITNLLRGHGIDAWIDNECSAVMGEFPIGAIPYIICVPAGQDSEAGEIVTEALRVMAKAGKRRPKKRAMWFLLAAYVILPSIAGLVLYLLGQV